MMDLENMPERALAFVQAGQGAVIATVIETWGSAPRQVGAQMVVAGTGEMAGSVSGGCVEWGGRLGGNGGAGDRAGAAVGIRGQR